jgi:hypothetical protein
MRGTLPLLIAKRKRAPTHFRAEALYGRFDAVRQPQIEIERDADGKPHPGGQPSWKRRTEARKLPYRCVQVPRWGCAENQRGERVTYGRRVPGVVRFLPGDLSFSVLAQCSGPCQEPQSSVY